jgi:hypothetical protein
VGFGDAEVTGHRRSSGPLVVLVLTVAAVAVVVGAASFLTARASFASSRSPDGAFTVIVSSRRFEDFVPRSPGSGSDRPGFIEVRRVSDDRSCGEASVPMVGLATDLRWNLAGSPRTAVVIGAAVWNLDTCTLDTTGW